MKTTTDGNVAALADVLSAILRGEQVAWSAIGRSSADFVAACDAEDLIVLVHERVAMWPGCDWPTSVRHELVARAHAAVAEELRRQHELRAVLDALARAEVRPILVKGTPLAYSVYLSPSERPRLDTDLLVRQQDVAAVRCVMAQIGYTAPVACDGELLFRQFELTREDQFGVQHVFDFHWKISTQSVFADVLTYDELSVNAAAVPALGPHARAAGIPHGLLLACIHPVMHHGNLERIIWTYDIHLLASRLSSDDLELFTNLAVVKGIGPICARQLAIARSRFGTRLPEHTTSRLLSTGKPALTDYLRPGRRWHHEFLSNLRGLTSWRERIRLAREVFFPGPLYMLSSYRITNRVQGFAVLPVLYFHRNLHGLWRVLVGRK